MQRVAVQILHIQWVCFFCLCPQVFLCSRTCLMWRISCRKMSWRVWNLSRTLSSSYEPIMSTTWKLRYDFYFVSLLIFQLCFVLISKKYWIWTPFLNKMYFCNLQSDHFQWFSFAEGQKTSLHSCLRLLCACSKFSEQMQCHTKARLNNACSDTTPSIKNI